MTSDFLSNLQTKVELAPYTTINLGGTAKYFINCTSLELLKFALTYARDHHLTTHILGGGSNTIFPTSGFGGLIIRIAMRGCKFSAAEQFTTVTAAAGEPWDDLVSSAVARGLGGIENMSGIPGTVGAAPVQNVGAYGQEVSQVITSVTALDRSTLKEKIFNKEQCQFGYRTSRFKAMKPHRYVITGVTFRLINEGQPAIAYPDVVAEIGGASKLSQYGRGQEALTFMRQSVLNVRRRKSMVIDPQDPHSRSCGSFFVNPILTADEHHQLTNITSQTVPFRQVGESLSISAAWLVEQAGFPKGYRQDGVGISDHHNLALVNYGGTTDNLLALAQAIQNRVAEKFGLKLAIEPVIV